MSDLPIQNIPVPGNFGGAIRALFRAKLPAGVDPADYSAVEMRMLAERARQLGIYDGSRVSVEGRRGTARLRTGYMDVVFDDGWISSVSILSARPLSPLEALAEAAEE